MRSIKNPILMPCVLTLFAVALLGAPFARAQTIEYWPNPNYPNGPQGDGAAWGFTTTATNGTVNNNWFTPFGTWTWNLTYWEYNQPPGGNGIYIDWWGDGVTVTSNATVTFNQGNPAAYALVVLSVQEAPQDGGTYISNGGAYTWNPHYVGSPTASMEWTCYSDSLCAAGSGILRGPPGAWATYYWGLTQICTGNACTATLTTSFSW